MRPETEVWQPDFVLMLPSHVNADSAQMARLPFAGTVQRPAEHEPDDDEPELFVLPGFDPGAA